MEKIIINKNKITSIKLDFFSKEDIDRHPFINDEKEHYKLLVFMTNNFDGITIIDAGTHRGLSSICLAQNPKNKVITYDIEKNPYLSKSIEDYENIECKIKNINSESDDILKNSEFILLDIDPHDGGQEKVFMEKLESMDYKGFVICDDINLNSEMRNWWFNIRYPKFDLTEVGHHSGTGIISMGNYEFFLI